MQNTLEVGKVVNIHGLNGEVKLVSWCDFPQKFDDFEAIFIKGRSHKILGIKYQKSNVILKLEGINTVEAAQSIRDEIATINRDDFGDLPAGTFFVCDMIGMSVKLEDGQPVGTLEDVMPNGSADLYVVRAKSGKVHLIPAIKQNIKSISLEEKTIIITPSEGLLEL